MGEMDERRAMSRYNEGHRDGVADERDRTGSIRKALTAERQRSGSLRQALGDWVGEYERSDRALATARAEIERLETDLEFWMGEGDSDWPPENKRWRELHDLVGERTPEQTAEIRELARVIREKVDPRVHYDHAEQAEAERDEYKHQLDAAKCCDNHQNVVDQLQEQIKQAEAALGRFTKCDITGSLCPECGPGVSVDEDGGCCMCGITSVGSGVEAVRAQLATMREQRDAALIDGPHGDPVMCQRCKRVGCGEQVFAGLDGCVHCSKPDDEPRPKMPVPDKYDNYDDEPGGGEHG